MAKARVRFPHEAPNFVARVAKLVKAPVRKTGHREFESHRVLLMRRWSRNQARLAHNQQIIRCDSGLRYQFVMREE